MSTRVEGVLSTAQVICCVVNAYDLMLENTVVDEMDRVLFRGRDWYLELVGVQSME